MATGNSFGRTVEGSDESFDLVCSPCVKKNRNREATQYCVDCEDYYCSTCVGCHDDIPVLSGHKILERSDFPTDGSNNLVTLPTERCRKHITKLVDMFCQNHDQTGCSICMAVKHRSCKDVFYIPEEVDNIFENRMMEKVIEDLKQSNDQLQAIIKARQIELDEGNKDKIIALDSIKEFRKKINRTLDQLEKLTIENLEAKHETIQKKLKSQITSMNGIVKEMEACQQQLKSADGNRSQQFVSLKKCQEKVSDSGRIRKEAAECSTDGIQFVKDDDVLKCVDGLKSLGNITEKTSSQVAQFHRHDTLYKVTGRQQFTVVTSSDRIFGSCILTDGTLLLTWCKMKKLKRLDSSTYKVIDECDMPDSPTAVCEISPQEAGVTLDNNTIQLVSLGSKMAPTRSIKMSHFCYGLAVSNGEMFVSDQGKNVYVHDTSGTLLRTICKDQSGADIFSSTRHITVSDDGSKIYVSDVDKGVIVLDRNGGVLWRFCDPELSETCGVCTDGCGNVFVCGYKYNNVVQFGPSGNKIGVIAKQTDGISHPIPVCFDRSSSKMIVANENSNGVVVLDLV